MTAERERAGAADLTLTTRPTLADEFFARAATPLIVVARDLTVVSANAAAGELMDLEIGDNVLEGFWSVSATAIMRLVDAARRRVASSPVSARTVHDRLVEVDGFLLGENGDGFVGLMVTDRSGVDEAQRRLEEQQERYRSLFEWAPVAMREDDFTEVGEWLERLRVSGVTDLASYLEEHPAEVREAIDSVTIKRVNQAMVELLAAPSSLAVLRGFRDREPTSGAVEGFIAMFLAIWEGRGDNECDFVGVDFAGNPFECRLRAIVPETAGGHDLSRVVAIMLDLTELRAATRRLERLVADKDRFVASVSHELRTPLAAVYGTAEELVTNWEQFEPDELRELVGMVAGQGAELTAIVEDLLVAANLESGKVAINPEIVSLNGLAREAWSDCQRSNPGLDGHSISGPETSAYADPVRVRQIVRNLVTNAVRYGGDRVSIRVAAETHSFVEQVRPYIEVIDDGEGIPLEQRESVFDPYFQADEKERVLGSLGLGLAISRELARRMDGDLTYRFQNGQSVFRLELPPS